MGRQPSVNKNLPPRMRARRQKSGKVYYYYDTGSRPRHEVPLGSDYVLAVQQWAQLHQAKPTATMTVAWAIGKYMASLSFQSVSTGTQADYKFALDKIMEHFGDAPLDQVRPSHVTLYIEHRSKASPHRALREKAVMSMLYTWAIEREYCTTNPAGAVKTKRLPGRKNITISDDMLDAVYDQAPQDLKDCIDLAYYIGQRPADILKLSEADIKRGVLSFRQNKTQHPIEIVVSGPLAELLERIRQRKREHDVRVLALLVDERGLKMTKSKLRSRFEAARTAAGIDGKLFQFRDLRRKAGGDLREQSNLDAAQALLGHSSQAMTEHYTAGRGHQIKQMPMRKTNVRK
jgi:integrase